MTKALRVLIADDESMARRRLRRLLDAMPEADVVGECQSGADVLAALSADRPDVVLLDVRMPGLSGTEAMALWPADGPSIVFVTAHAEHAVTAFDGGAVDYVLKPVSPERLHRALRRVAARRHADPGGGDIPPRLPLTTREGVVLLRPDEVLAAVIDGETTTVTTDRGTYYTDRRLSALAARLPQHLTRVHRRALLNLARVARLEHTPSGGYVAVTDGGDSVPVSRQHARELRKRWGLSST